MHPELIKFNDKVLQLANKPHQNTKTLTPPTFKIWRFDVKHKSSIRLNNYVLSGDMYACCLSPLSQFLPNSANIHYQLFSVWYSLREMLVPTTQLSHGPFQGRRFWRSSVIWIWVQTPELLLKHEVRRWGNAIKLMIQAACLCLFHCICYCHCLCLCSCVCHWSAA